MRRMRRMRRIFDPRSRDAVVIDPVLDYGPATGTEGGPVPGGAG